MQFFANLAGMYIFAFSKKEKQNEWIFCGLVRGLTPPLARAMAMIAAASITQDRGFHMNPKNFKILLSCSKHKHTTIHSPETNNSYIH